MTHTSSWMTAGLAARSRRLVAAALAIIIGVGFLTTSLIVLSTVEAGTKESIAAGVRDSDLVVSVQDEPITTDAYDAIAAVDGVQRAIGAATIFGERGPGQFVHGTPLVPERMPLQTGRFPESDTEIVASTQLAKSADISVGDTLTASFYGDGDEPTSTTLTVVGIADFSTMGTWLAQADSFGATDAAVRAIQPGITYTSVILHLTDSANAETVRDGIAAISPTSIIRTGPEEADYRINHMTKDTGVLSALVLGFSIIALLTTAIVIANTFAITLAQRATDLALLRCVGATTSQVRRSVLLEAAVLGLLASIGGVSVGIAAAWGLFTVASGRELPFPLLAGLVVPPVSLIIALVLGVLTTVLAGLWPAVRASRVSPLAALRPADPVIGARGTSALQIAVAVLLIALGTAAMAYAALTGSVFPGLLGGTTTFLGVVVGLTLVVPLGVLLLGLLARPAGVPGHLAVDNAVRNPGRAAATSAALIVGVTLMTMTSVGAASGQRTALAEIDGKFSFDAYAVSGSAEATGSEGGSDTPGDEFGGGVGDLPGPALTAAELDAKTRQTLTEIPGVATTSPLTSGWVRLGEADASVQALGVDPATARDVIRSTAVADGLQPGTLGMSSFLLAIHGLDLGQTLRVSGPAGSLDLRIVPMGMGNFPALTTSDLTAIVGEAPVSGLMLRLAEDADISSTVSELSATTAEAGLSFGGPAAERAVYTRILDGLVLATLVLLGAAIVISLVGIANTLSLSVIERRREHALLRGLGLTRSQMRGMLLVEGVLIALVSAVIGIGLGMFFAWLGVQTVLPSNVDVQMAVPWSRLGLLVLVALLAGVLASALPGRRAAQVSPAAGLVAV